jgi:26S proteasome regulatory subunit T1
MAPKSDWEKYKKPDEDSKDEDKIVALDEGDIQLLKTYGQGPYAAALKSLENEIKEVQKRVNEKMGVKESDTGLAPPNLWDLKADEERMKTEQPLQVARCTKIIKAGSDKPASEGAAANGALGGAGTAATQSNGQSEGAAGDTSAQTPMGFGDRLAALRNMPLGEMAPGQMPGLGLGPKPVVEEDKYVINVKQIAKFVVGLGERVAPTDIEEGMRVG